MDFTAYKKHSNTFIETGTHIGTSVKKAIAAGFEVIKSVEAYKEFYLIANSKFKDNKRVQIFFGKSTERLPEMIKNIPIPSVFWLDAHPSGPGTAGHDELMAGEKDAYQDNILEKEIDIIINDGRHVILIDDQQGWATAQRFADQIEKYYPGGYTFEIVDEDLPGIHHKEKVLICLPASLQAL